MATKPLSAEQEALLALSADTLPEVEHKRQQIDVHGDRQRYLANTDSLWEVTLGGKTVSGPVEDINFDKCLRMYDNLIVKHKLEVCIVHVLNGVRTVTLRSSAVRVVAHPSNPIGISWEDE